MPTVTFNHELIRRLQLNVNVVHDPEEWSEKLELIGCSISKCNDEIVEIEVFPDRPDLLSAETMAFAARTFLHEQEASPELKVTKGDITMTVDESLEKVRPVIFGAIVRGVDTGHTEEARNEFIQGIMDHQEKIHHALGRGRKRTSVGVHDLSKLQPPFRVVTVDS